jgi:DNA-binding MarR family transcriptional regulator
MAPDTTVESPELARPIDFADAMGRFLRTVRRSVRAGLPGPALPASETELLALVHRMGGIGVAEAADLLQVAPNTVSTLVGHLRRAGLLRRTPDPADRRAARLNLTQAGVARVSEVRKRRDNILNEAFSRLSPEDRDSILSSLPALERLIDALSTELGARE